MKAILYLISLGLGFWSLLLFARGFTAFGRAASSAGPEAQGGGFGVMLLAVVVAVVAWKAFAKARSTY